MIRVIPKMDFGVGEWDLYFVVNILFLWQELMWAIQGTWTLLFLYSELYILFLIIPMIFLKKAMEILQSPPSISHAISTLTNWQNQTKFGVWVAHMNWACNGTFFLGGPAPWGGAKRSNIFKFQLQSQFQIFLNILTNERYKTYQWGFIFIRWPGSCPRDGSLGISRNWGLRLVKKLIFLNLNQIWCVSYSHEWYVQQCIFLSLPPGAFGMGQKV